MMVLGLGPFLTGRALDINDFTALFSLFGIIPRLFILVILNSLFAGAIPPPSDSALRRRSHLRQLPIILGIKVLPKFDLISFNLYCRWCEKFNPAGGIAARICKTCTALVLARTERYVSQLTRAVVCEGGPSEIASESCFSTAVRWRRRGLAVGRSLQPWNWSTRF